MKIFIEISSLVTGEVIDRTCGYDYHIIDYALTSKLNNLLYVTAERKIDESDVELFHFNHGEIYTQPSFNLFLDLLDEGVIMYDIRIGTYSSGKNYGKAHDHGSGFRIKETDLKRLYSDMEII